MVEVILSGQTASSMLVNSQRTSVMVRANLSGKMVVSTKEAGFVASSQEQPFIETIMVSADKEYGLMESASTG